MGQNLRDAGSFHPTTTRYLTLMCGRPARNPAVLAPSFHRENDSAGLSWAWRAPAIHALKMTATPSRLSRVVRHRIVVGVQHPARLDRRNPCAAEQKMSTSWLTSGPIARVVWIAGGGITATDGAAAPFVLVLAPGGHVRGPRPADVVNVSALERERALLEVVVEMRRQLRDVARPGPRVEIVDHEVRAAENSPEPALLASARRGCRRGCGSRPAAPATARTAGYSGAAARRRRHSSTSPRDPSDA